MSISQSIYVGPAVKCIKRVVQKQFTFRACSKVDCPKYPTQKKKKEQEGRCCTECGSPIISHPEPKLRECFEPDWSVLERAFIDAGIENYETLTGNGFASDGESDEIWVVSEVNDRRCEYGKDMFVDFQDIDIASEKLWVQNQFRQQLEVMSKLYHSIEIVWCVCGYES